MSLVIPAGSGCFSIQLGEDVPDKAPVRVHYNGYLEYAVRLLQTAWQAAAVFTGKWYGPSSPT